MREPYIIWAGIDSSQNGMGVCTHNTLKILQKKYNIDFYALHTTGRQNSIEKRTRNKIADIVIMDLPICFGTPNWFRARKAYRSIMWDVTRLPESWVRKYYQGFDGFIMPSKFCVNTAIASGMKGYMKVIYPPLDYNFYLPVKRKIKEPVTFVTTPMASLCCARKNMPCLVKAFKKAFGESKYVKLIIKCATSIKKGWRSEEDRLMKEWACSNIEIIRDFYNREQLRELLYKSHFYVLPTRGEGYCLAYREAVLTGIPAIVTDAAACLENSPGSMFWIASDKIDGNIVMEQLYGQADYGHAINPKASYLAEQLTMVVEKPQFYLDAAEYDAREYSKILRRQDEELNIDDLIQDAFSLPIRKINPKRIWPANK